MQNKAAMWTLGQKATKYNKLPSEFFPELFDEWARWQLDSCVTYFMLVVENALGEREEVGSGKHKEWRQKYELAQLLDDDFRMPRPPTKLQKRQAGAANLLAMAADPASKIKLWRELRPGEQPPAKEG